MPKSRTWYEIRNAADPALAEVFIYDDIGESFWTQGVTAKGFIDELNAITAPAIDLHINSAGGSVFEGVAIANAIKRHRADVTTYVDGLAASIASIIAIAGDRVVMASNALFMIHNPWGGVSGDANDMRKMADVLDKIGETLAADYVDRTGMSTQEALAAMSAETWYTSTEALAAGFIDEIGVEVRVAASVNLDRFNYRHVPVQALAALAAESEPDQLVRPGEEETPDSVADGSSEAAPTSDGASEDPTEETEPAAEPYFVPGVGFIDPEKEVTS